MRLRIVVAVFALIVTGAAQTAAPKAATQPATPPLVSFDVSAMDRSLDPCADFYRYACAGWMAKNPIPPDQSRWGRFGQLQERNRDILHDILERAARPDPKRSAVIQKIGDMYASCMDEAKVDVEGAKPIQPELQRIAKITSRRTSLTPSATCTRSASAPSSASGPPPTTTTRA